MSFRSDKLPLDQMLPHQLRMLSRSKSKVQNVIVLANEPPWVLGDTSNQSRSLQQLTDVAKVIRVNYSLLNSTSFLRRFLIFDKESRNISVGSLLHRQPMNGIRNGPMFASNLHGMLHFLDQCVSAPNDTDLCVYFDPDVFVHRRQGMHLEKDFLEGASEVFAKNPHVILVSPPNVCDYFSSGPSTGGCTANRSWVSQRHQILNRTRLMSALPFHVGKPFVTAAWPYFETWFSSGLKGRFAIMKCGSFGFVVHPPGPDDKQDAGLRWLSSTQPGSNTSTIVSGTAELIRRIEAGRVTNVTNVSCWNMEPSYDRVMSGMAW